MAFGPERACSLSRATSVDTIPFAIVVPASLNGPSASITTPRTMVCAVAEPPSLSRESSMDQPSLAYAQIRPPSVMDSTPGAMARAALAMSRSSSNGNISVAFPHLTPCGSWGPLMIPSMSREASVERIPFQPQAVPCSREASPMFFRPAAVTTAPSAFAQCISTPRAVTPIQVRPHLGQLAHAIPPASAGTMPRTVVVPCQPCYAVGSSVCVSQPLHQGNVQEQKTADASRQPNSQPSQVAREETGGRKTTIGTPQASLRKLRVPASAQNTPDTKTDGRKDGARQQRTTSPQRSTPCGRPMPWEQQNTPNTTRRKLTPSVTPRDLAKATPTPQRVPTHKTANSTAGGATPRTDSRKLLESARLRDRSASAKRLDSARKRPQSASAKNLHLQSAPVSTPPSPPRERPLSPRNGMMAPLGRLGDGLTNDLSPPKNSTPRSPRDNGTAGAVRCAPGAFAWVAPRRSSGGASTETLRASDRCGNVGPRSAHTAVDDEDESFHLSSAKPASDPAFSANIEKARTDARKPLHRLGGA